MRDQQRANLVAALEAARWRIAGKGGAAELLGIRPSTLADRMKTLEIRRPAAAREGRGRADRRCRSYTLAMANLITLSRLLLLIVVVVIAYQPPSLVPAPQRAAPDPRVRHGRTRRLRGPQAPRNQPVRRHVRHRRRPHRRAHHVDRPGPSRAGAGLGAHRVRRARDDRRRDPRQPDDQPPRQPLRPDGIPLGKWLVAGRFMRALYAVAKATAFCWLLLLQPLPVVAPACGRTTARRLPPSGRRSSCRRRPLPGARPARHRRVRLQRASRDSRQPPSPGIVRALTRVLALAVFDVDGTLVGGAQHGEAPVPRCCSAAAGSSRAQLWSFLRFGAAHAAEYGRAHLEEEQGVPRGPALRRRGGAGGRLGEAVGAPLVVRALRRAAAPAPGGGRHGGAAVRHAPVPGRRPGPGTRRHAGHRHAAAPSAAGRFLPARRCATPLAPRSWSSLKGALRRLRTCPPATCLPTATRCTTCRCCASPVVPSPCAPTRRLRAAAAAARLGNTRQALTPGRCSGTITRAGGKGSPRHHPGNPPRHVLAGNGIAAFWPAILLLAPGPARARGRPRHAAGDREPDPGPAQAAGVVGQRLRPAGRAPPSRSSTFNRGRAAQSGLSHQAGHHLSRRWKALGPDLPVAHRSLCGRPDWRAGP